MSIGPQLPPHLQRLRDDEREDDSDQDDGIGPALPPNSSTQEDSDSDEDIGPKLPEVPCRGPKPDSEDSSSDDDYGPALPPHLANRSAGDTGGAGGQNADDEFDSDDDAIGPRPPKPGELHSLSASQASDIERRAQAMRDRIEGKDQKVVKRESWMLELPDAKAKHFGLGPRSFSRKGTTEIGDRSGWTETPEDKERRARGEEVEGEGEDTEEERKRTEYLINKARDDEMSKVTEKLKKKRGNESLLEMHEKERKKKSKKEKNEPKERRPFDRDADLGANKFDDAQRKLMIKKAAQIDSRFSSGQQKFL